jgi:hypothetical protein
MIVFMLLMSVFKNNIWVVLPMFCSWLFFSLCWRFIKANQPRYSRRTAPNLGGTRGSPRFRPGYVSPDEAAKAKEAEAVMRDFKQFEDEVDARTRHLRPEPKKRAPQNYAETHCHAILGITAADSQKTIKEAYRCKARQYHPDTAPDGLGSNTKFDMIKQAYEYAMYLRSRKI